MARRHRLASRVMLASALAQSLLLFVAGGQMLAAVHRYVTVGGTLVVALGTALAWGGGLMFVAGIVLARAVARMDRPGRITDTDRLNRLEWGDGWLTCDESGEYNVWRYNDLATPPTAEHPDGEIQRPTVRQVLDEAILARRRERRWERYQGEDPLAIVAGPALTSERWHLWVGAIENRAARDLAELDAEAGPEWG